MSKTDQLDALMIEYARRFKEGFPSFQLLRGLTDDEAIETVQRCLDAGKTAYDLGLLTDGEDVEY